MNRQSPFNSTRWWVVLGVVAASSAITIGAISTSSAESNQSYEPKFNAAGEMIRPEGWRDWMFIGTPLTPNSLNPPEAPFPEFHNVYIDPVSWAHYQKTGEFRDGTVIAKELVLVGATKAVSGNGFFMGEFAGFEISYKSTEHFPDEPGNWAYFSFGHQPEPYNETAAKQPVEACASCHSSSAAQDLVFTQYYPVVRAAKPK